jgi:hypothetical protein
MWSQKGRSVTITHVRTKAEVTWFPLVLEDHMAVSSWLSSTAARHA